MINPEITIPFLSGNTPWSVVDATDQETFESRNFAERQLVGWLTLPLASQVINEYITEPLIEQGTSEGLQLITDGLYPDRLDKDIAKAQSATRTGNASPPYVHIAVDPHTPEALTLFVPTAQNRYRHLAMDVKGKLTVRGSGNLELVNNPNRKVSISAKANRKLTLLSTSENLKVPGNSDFAASAPECKLPKNPASSITRVYRTGGVSGVKF